MDEKILKKNMEKVLKRLVEKALGRFDFLEQI